MFGDVAAEPCRDRHENERGGKRDEAVDREGRLELVNQGANHLESLSLDGEAAEEPVKLSLMNPSRIFIVAGLSWMESGRGVFPSKHAFLSEPKKQ